MPNRAKLIIPHVISIPLLILFLGVLLFLPAGNLYWLNGWLLIGSLVLYIILNFLYFLIRDPATLERRSKLSTEKGDTIFFVLINILFFSLMILPALDYRLGWSRFPFWLSMIGLAGLIFSFLILFLVMRENSFASKGLRIHEGQKVITTGLYSLVRHPLYIGGTLMGFSIPLLLGSWFALIPAILPPFIYAFRIRKEEKMLLRELEGYDEYRLKVRYKMFPGIW